MILYRYISALVTCFIILTVIAQLPSVQAWAGGPAPNPMPKNAEHYQFSYNIKRDGALIGSYHFDVRKGRDSYSFDAELAIDVSVFGFSVYELKHRRNEEWRNGKLVSLEGRSVYDGDERYNIKLERGTGQTYRLQVNGNTQHLKERVVSFSPRQPDNWKEAKLISLKGNADAVMKNKLESTQLTVNGKRHKAAHYRLEGDVIRDLWYDANGRLLKLSYKKDGATITFVRKRVAPGK